MKAYLELAETEKLENAATCVRDKLLIRVLAKLGCRISEALALTVEDIDFDEGTVRIEHLKSRVRLICTSCNAQLGKSHAFCPKCGKAVDKAVMEERQHRRMRALPVDRETLELLREYIDRGGPVSWNGKNLIFGIGRQTAWRVVKECAERAGLGKLFNPEPRPLMEKYCGGKAGVPAEHRIRALKLVKDLSSVDEAILSIHAEGSLAAQRLSIFNVADPERFKAAAKRACGIEGGEGHAVFSQLPQFPGAV